MKLNISYVKSYHYSPNKRYFNYFSNFINDLCNLCFVPQRNFGNHFHGRPSNLQMESLSSASPWVSHVNDFIDSLYLSRGAAWKLHSYVNAAVMPKLIEDCHKCINSTHYDSRDTRASEWAARSQRRLSPASADCRLA